MAEIPGLGAISPWWRRLLTRLRFNKDYSRRPAVLTVSKEGLELKAYQVEGASIVLRPCWSFHWDEVTEIHAFKRDCFAVDQIRLCFGLQGGLSAEVTEDCVGYSDLTTALLKEFEGMDGDWWHKVAFPAFATNLTCIWRRRDPESGSAGTRAQ